MHHLLRENSAAESETPSMPFTTQKPRSAMRTAKRIILGLTFVTVFAGLIAGLVIWRIHATRVTATAIFRVATETPALLADELSQRHEERDYEYFKNSQLAALRSHWLLTAA